MTHPHTPTRYRFVAIFWLLLICLVCSGCEAPGFLAYVIGGPPKTKKRYTLEKQTTLVIVDDPESLLGDQNNPTVVAANVGFHLTKNKVLLPDQIVSQDHLTVLATQMGDRFMATPIDQIGKRLKSDQVIHVQVRSVQLQGDNTYYEPSAEVEVKVINSLTGERLFPVNEKLTPGESHPGEIVLIEMERQRLDETRRHSLPMMKRALAERIGLEVAGLFYDHVAPEDEPKV